MSFDVPTIWTVSDVATWLSWSALRVKRAAKGGEIPSKSLPNGQLVFVAEELIEWFSALLTPAPPEEARRAQ